MAWYSILPERFSGVEKVVSAICIVFALLIIGPWILVFVYDFLLYIWRVTTHHTPIIGGAARGRQRPRAPSLMQRPGGLRREPPLSGLGLDGNKDGDASGRDENEQQSGRRDSIFSNPNNEHVYLRRRSLMTFNTETRSLEETFG